MAVTFYDLTSAAGLKKLDDFLLLRSILAWVDEAYAWL